jgi:hypothetical protein
MMTFGILRRSTIKKRDHLPGCLIVASRREVVEVVDEKVAAVVVDGVAAVKMTGGGALYFSGEAASCLQKVVRVQQNRSPFLSC